MRRVTRRRVLLCGSGVALTAFAGCSGDIPIGPDESTDVFLNNDTGSERTVTLRLTRMDDGEAVLDETVTVEADATRGFSDLVDGEAVEVTVNVEGGPEGTYEWTETGGENALSVAIDSSSIGFAVATAE